MKLPKMRAGLRREKQKTRAIFALPPCVPIAASMRAERLPLLTIMVRTDAGMLRVLLCVRSASLSTSTDGRLSISFR